MSRDFGSSLSQARAPHIVTNKKKRPIIEDDSDEDSDEDSPVPRKKSAKSNPRTAGKAPPKKKKRVATPDDSGEDEESDDEDEDEESDKGIYLLVWIIQATSIAGTADSNDGRPKHRKNRRGTRTRKNGKTVPRKRINNRIRRHDFDGETKRLIDIASADLNSRLMTSAPFADDETFTLEACRAWDRVRKSLDIHIELSSGVLECVSDPFNVVWHLIDELEAHWQRHLTPKPPQDIRSIYDQ